MYAEIEEIIENLTSFFCFLAPKRGWKKVINLKHIDKAIENKKYKQIFIHIYTIMIKIKQYGKYYDTIYIHTLYLYTQLFKISKKKKHF